MSFQLHLVGLSDIGNVRKRNEDSYSLAPSSGIAVVADGMGGHPGGDVASRTAAHEAATYLERHYASLSESPDEDVPALMAEWAQAAVIHAHDSIRLRGEADPELVGMGTTLTTFFPHPGSGAFVISHVGDSRAYRLRSDVFSQLTTDDTWVQERVDADEFTVEQARNHPFGHILTQCVGLESEPEPQLTSGTLEHGDVYLLCTDGLLGAVETEEIQAHLAFGPEEVLKSSARSLVELAKERGGLDNITVVLVAVEEATAS